MAEFNNTQLMNILKDKGEFVLKSLGYPLDAKEETERNNLIEIYKDIVSDNSSKLEKGRFLENAREYVKTMNTEVTELPKAQKPSLNVTLIDASDNYHTVSSWNNLAKDIKTKKKELTAMFKAVEDATDAKVASGIINQYNYLFSFYFIRLYKDVITHDTKKLEEKAARYNPKYYAYEDISKNIDAELKNFSEYKEVETGAVNDEEWISLLLNSKYNDKFTWGNYFKKQIDNILDLEEEKKKSIRIKKDADSFASELTTYLLRPLYSTGFDSFEEVGIIVPRYNDGDDILFTIKNGTYKGYKSEDPINPETSPKKFTILGKQEHDEKKLGILQDRFNNLSHNIAQYMMQFSSINMATFYSYIYDNEKLLPDSLATFEMAYLVKLHACFQKADARIATGIISIQRWLTEKIKEGGEKVAHYQQLKDAINSGKTKLTDYSDVEDWYKWCLENIYYKYASEGVADRESINNLVRKEQVDAYKEVLFKGIGKVVVVTSCSVSDTYIDEFDLKLSWYPSIGKLLGLGEKAVDADIVTMAKKTILNIAGADKLENMNGDEGSVRAVHLGSKECTMINVSFASATSDDKLFAKDILNKLVESDNLPNWHNVILGRRQEPEHKGAIFAYQDFLNPKKNTMNYRAYAIYAGSRSGKGTMTSAILASAIASGVKIFYIDGKPENGAILGRVAWEQGFDTFTFDGQPEGMKEPFAGPMEEFTYRGEFTYSRETENLVRNNQGPNMYWNAIPSELRNFLGAKGLEQFSGLMRYLKGMNLFADIMGVRATGDIPEGDTGCAWVFDEMTSMCSVNEAAIRRRFAEYCAMDKDAKIVKKDGCLIAFKVPYPADKNRGVYYIYKWIKWTEKIVSKLIQARTITFGPSNMDLFMIFQEASWLSEYKETCTIAKFVDTFSGCTKILGARGISPACGAFGDARTATDSWYTELTEKTQWAIIQGDVRDVKNNPKSAVIIKPFEIWTIPLTPKVMAAAKADKEFGKQFFAGYMEALYEAQQQFPEALHTTIPERLAESFAYAERLIDENNWNPKTVGTDDKGKLVNYLPGVVGGGDIPEGPNENDKDSFQAWNTNSILLRYMYNMGIEAFDNTYSFNLQDYRTAIALVDGEPKEISEKELRNWVATFEKESEEVIQELKNLENDINNLEKGIWTKELHQELIKKALSIGSKIGDDSNLFNDEGKNSRTLHGYLLEELRQIPIAIENDEEFNNQVKECYYGKLKGNNDGTDYKIKSISKYNYIKEDGVYGIMPALNALLDRLDLIEKKNYLLQTDGNLDIFEVKGYNVGEFQRITTEGVKTTSDEETPRVLIHNITLPQLATEGAKTSETVDKVMGVIDGDYNILLTNYAAICNKLLDYILLDKLVEYQEDLKIFRETLTDILKKDEKSNRNNKHINSDYRVTLTNYCNTIVDIEAIVGKKSDAMKLMTVAESADSDDDNNAPVAFRQNSDSATVSESNTLIYYNGVIGRLLTNFNAVESLTIIIPDLVMSSSSQEKEQGYKLVATLKKLVKEDIVKDLQCLNNMKLNYKYIPANSEKLTYSKKDIEDYVDATKLDFIKSATEFNKVIDELGGLIR